MINNNGRQSVLDYDDILKRYVAFRTTSKELNSKLIRLLSKTDLTIGARKLGMLGRENVLVLHNNQEFSLLMDYSIHSVLNHGKNLVDRLVENPPDDFSPEEVNLLPLLAQSRYTVFGIEAVEPDVGISAVDMFYRGERIFVADLAFGQTAEEGIVLAGRLIPLGGFFATGGAVLPVRLDLLKPITRIVDKVIPPSEAEKISEVTRTQEAEFSGNIIRLLLDHGAISEIAYETFDRGNDDLSTEYSEHEAAIEEEPQEAFEPSRKKVGRNDPCPCGSGSKYKKCCGGK